MQGSLSAPVRRIALLSVVLLTLIAPVGLAGEGPVYTWRGPQSDGVFPAADLVTSCDEATAFISASNTMARLDVVP